MPVILAGILWIRTRVSTPEVLHLRNTRFLNITAGVLLVCVLLLGLVRILAP